MSINYIVVVQFYSGDTISNQCSLYVTLDPTFNYKSNKVWFLVPNQDLFIIKLAVEINKSMLYLILSILFIFNILFIKLSDPPGIFLELKLKLSFVWNNLSTTRSGVKNFKRNLRDECQHPSGSACGLTTPYVGLDLRPRTLSPFHTIITPVGPAYDLTLNHALSSPSLVTLKIVL